MIRAIANQKIDLSIEEYQYYLELEKSFGKDIFLGLFKTNDLGQVISVLPHSSNPTAMIIVFFFLNVSFNQRLRRLDDFIDRVKNLENRIIKIEEESNE